MERISHRRFFVNFSLPKNQRLSFTSPGVFSCFEFSTNDQLGVFLEFHFPLNSKRKRRAREKLLQGSRRRG